MRLSGTGLGLLDPTATSVCSCICIYLMYILHHPSTYNQIKNKLHTLLRQQNCPHLAVLKNWPCKRTQKPFFFCIKMLKRQKKEYAAGLQAGQVRLSRTCQHGQLLMNFFFARGEGKKEKYSKHTGKNNRNIVRLGGRDISISI